MEKRRMERSQSGQVLILLVLALAGILAFTALAIDGAIIYSDRRIAQNGADASSVSGADAVIEYLKTLGRSVLYINWDCENLDLAEDAGDDAAIAHAGLVDFTIGYGLDNYNGVQTRCVEEWNGTYTEKYIEIPVAITDQTQTSFLHLIFNGSVVNQVESKTRVFPADSGGKGMTLRSLSDDCHGNDGGIEFSGNVTVTIGTGGILSDSCLIGNGSPGGVEVLVGGGNTITYVTEHTGNKPMTPEPVQVPLIPDPVFPAPDCSLLDDDYNDFDGGGEIYPGRYNSISHQNDNDGQLFMHPGGYCVTDDFSITGGIVEGYEVTIYIVNGGFETAGNAEIHFTPPISSNSWPFQCISLGCEPDGASKAGYLIYLAEGNTSEVKLEGNEFSTISGLVYAQDGTVKIGGATSSMTDFGIQVIANTIKIHGGAELDLTFDDEDIPPGFMRYEVAK